MFKVGHARSPVRPRKRTKSQLNAAAPDAVLRGEAWTGVYGAGKSSMRPGSATMPPLHYHFGSKEELIRQMVVDGAAVLDSRRREIAG